MKDFQTQKSQKLIKDITVNGKDIYINLSASNMFNTAGFVNKINLEDPEQMDKMAQMLFPQESYELVSMLDLEDFIVVLTLASELVEGQEKTVKDRFSRA
jgi:hypothetical protein